MDEVLSSLPKKKSIAINYICVHLFSLARRPLFTSFFPSLLNAANIPYKPTDCNTDMVKWVQIFLEA